MPARPPAGNASSIIGMLSAASTRATSDGDDESDVINQPAPTSCIHVPTFETIVAIQRLRKSALRNGLHGDVGVATAVVSAPLLIQRSAGLRKPASVTLDRNWAAARVSTN